jgi:membrane-associated phospholipid phosphatase
MEILHFLQSIRTDFLNQLFIVFTMLGEETFFMAVVCLVYWCLDKRFGYKIGFAYLSSGVLNSSLKNLFQVPRPFDVDPTLQPMRLESATGASFPSGHTQLAAAFWTSLALQFRRKWLYAVSAVLVLMVAFSRMYLGVHTLLDVSVGAVLGIAWVFVSNWLFEAAERTGKRWIMPVLSIPALVGLAFFPDADYYKIVGTFAGFSLGYFVESAWIRFPVRTAWWKQVLKFVLGMAVLVGLKGGLKAVLPETLASDLLRYFTMTVWVTVAAPLLFKAAAGKKRAAAVEAET